MPHSKMLQNPIIPIAMKLIKDTEKLYQDLKDEISILRNKIRELEKEQDKLTDEVANYVVDFGIYKGKTLAQIAYEDLSYYLWLIKHKCIPYTLHIKMDLYIRTKISEGNSFSQTIQNERTTEEQGFRGRYVPY